MFRKRATLILKTEDGIMLALHAFNFRYGLLGGGVKRGESLEDAARREILEELGLNIHGLKFLFNLDCCFQRHFVFYASVEGVPKRNWEVRKLIYFNGRDLRKVSLNSSSRRILGRYFSEKKGF